MSSSSHGPPDSLPLLAQTKKGRCTIPSAGMHQDGSTVQRYLTVPLPPKVKRIAFGSVADGMLVRYSKVLYTKGNCGTLGSNPLDRAKYRWPCGSAQRYISPIAPLMSSSTLHSPALRISLSANTHLGPGAPPPHRLIHPCSRPRPSHLTANFEP